MGCLFTKSKTRQYSSHAPRQIQVQKISINGTAQTNGPDVKSARDTEKRNGVDGRPGQIASAAKQPSARTLSPRPEPTLPPTPEEDRLPHSVQYAEDLEPVTPLPDVITVATLTPKRNRVDVSTVSFTSSEPSHRKNTMLSNNDVTIEDLDTGFDTDLDQYSRFSADSHPDKQRKDKNRSSSTDVLLPKRKAKHNESTNSETKNTSEPTRPKSRQKKKKHRKSKERPTIITAKTPESLDLEIEDLNEEDIVVGETTKDNHVSGKDNQPDKAVTKAAGGSKRETGETKAENECADCKEEAMITSEKSMEASSQFVPKDLFQKELEKERLKRKRKHRQRRKQTSESVNTHKVIVSKTEEDLRRGLKARSVSESRPGSGASLWTLDSAFSLRSQASRLNVTATSRDGDTTPCKSRNDSPASRFSYVPTGTTPLSFKQDAYEQEAQLIDLETEHGVNERAGDSVIVSARVTDPYYGIKPFKTEDEILENKSNIDDVESGTSTSYLLTKQKLLYSRFARRPNSESNSRLEGKPPLPPGSSLRMRPSSDTERGYTAFSRYFTTDLDIH